jgi:thiol-disulfide isomerase/thioredoxin
MRLPILASRRLAVALAAPGLIAAALVAAPLHAAAPGLPSTNVAWVPAASDTDVDRALARAGAERKPVLLYWGATWCPPCNRLKSQLFNRQDFAAQAKSFVAVHVDGDRPGAQKLGARFKVAGYPTVILLRSDGAELTRLAGSAEPEQVMDALRLGLAGGRPMRAVLADARSGKPLAAGEWRLLAFYAWEADEGVLVPEAERADLLADLALRCPPAEADASARLLLQALAAGNDLAGLKPDAAMRDRVLRIVDDPTASRTHLDALAADADALVQRLAPEGGAAREMLVARFDASLARLTADATLSRNDRAWALVARIDLARIGQGKDALQPRLPEALVRDTRELVARFEREAADGYERDALIPTLGHALSQAGLWAESDALLRASLPRSGAPYYLMSGLAGNARKQGRTDEALRWSRHAWERSEGPATRLQWGSAYLSMLVDLSPKDEARIEQTAAQLFREAGADKAAFHERSGRSLKRISNKLLAWNKEGVHAAAMARLRAQIDGVCRGVSAADGQRASCQALLKPAPAKAG